MGARLLSTVYRRSKILPTRLHDTRDIARQRQLPEAKPAQIELAKVPARAAASPAPVPMTDLELGLSHQFCKLRCSRHAYPPAFSAGFSAAFEPSLAAETCCRRCASCRNGMPKCRSSASASASLRASVTIEIFMPFVLSTLE